MKRSKMSSYKSKRNFRKGTYVKGVNALATPMRGGFRL